MLVPDVTTHGRADRSSCSPDIIESRVSVFIADQLSTDNLDNWVLALESGQEERERGRTLSSTKISDEDTIRILDPRENNSGRAVAGIPTGLSAGKHYTSDIIAPLRSHPVEPGPAPDVPLPVLGQTKSSANLNPNKAVKIAHPSPQRMGSHPVLRRASSDVTGLRWSRTCDLDPNRSAPDSPGPPPPRSPLRIQTNPQNIESLLAKTTARLEDENRKQTKLSSREPVYATRTTRETTVTFSPESDFRPGRGTSLAGNKLMSAASGTRMQKQSHSRPMDIIDAMIRPSQSSQTRKRLRRARPEGPRPLDLSRAEQQASSQCSNEITPVGTITLSTKRPAALSDLSDNVRIVSAIHSSSPKPGHVRGGSHGILKGRKSPGPRPRSAKMARTAGYPTSRSGSPWKINAEQETKVLPSPPPKKELPPTPIEKTHRVSRSTYSGRSIDAALARASSMEALPSPPSDESNELMFPSPPSSAVSPTKSTLARQFSERKGAGVEERLEALERRNQLLEAALMAVLKTGGTLNGCPCHVDSPSSDHSTHAAHGGLAKHGSIRSTVSSTDSGASALNMYLSTRGK